MLLVFQKGNVQVVKPTIIMTLSLILVLLVLLEHTQTVELQLHVHLAQHNAKNVPQLLLAQAAQLIILMVVAPVQLALLLPSQLVE